MIIKINFMEEVIKIKECIDGDKVHKRINRVIGQLNAINRMIEEDVRCEDILIQVNAAKSAIHKIGQIILEGHINHCVRDGIEHGDPDKTISDFVKAIEQFSKI